MKNNNTNNEFEEEIILNSLELLDPETKKQFDSNVKDLSDKDKEKISGFNNLVSLLPKILKLSGKINSPSDKVKEKLFERINSGKNKLTPDNKKGFDFIFSDSNNWVQHPLIDGIKVKRLAVNEEKGYMMLLMQAAAGAEYPSHHHNGAEECYVLEGDLFVEGKYLGPGDFHHAAGGSDHEPLRTKDGCTLLLVVDPRDY